LYNNKQFLKHFRYWILWHHFQSCSRLHLFSQWKWKMFPVLSLEWFTNSLCSCPRVALWNIHQNSNPHTTKPKSIL